MEAERLQALQLASNYEAMASSMAFRDMMVWLDEATESLELKAAQANPESKEHFQAYFTEWQQRKLVVQGIKNRIAVQLELKTELEDEVLNERPTSGDPAFYSGSTQLPGY